MVWRFFIVIFILTALVAGCATNGRESSGFAEAPKALDVSTALKFEDVPIPSGFRPVTDQSFTFQNDVLRVGILKYSGRADAAQVINFYKDQMPLYNWRFLNILEYGRYIMNFDREDQSCIVVVESTKFNTFVTITVSPKAGRASTYKPIKNQ